MRSCLLAENSINKLVLPPTCIPLKSNDKIILLLFYRPLACLLEIKSIDMFTLASNGTYFREHSIPQGCAYRKIEWSLEL